MDRYDAQGLAVSDRWEDDPDSMNDHSVCVAFRYLSAGEDAIDAGHTFDAWWMIRNWNTDFLAKQPKCK